MKLYTANALLASLILSLFSSNLYSMEKKKPIDFTKTKLLLCNYSGNFQKKFTSEQIKASPLLKNLIDPDKEESKYVFDVDICDEVVKAFVSYLQAYDSNELILDQDVLIPVQSLVEKKISSQNIGVLSSLLSLGKAWKINELVDFIRTAIVTKILDDRESENILGYQVAGLIRDYRLESLYQDVKHTLKFNPNYYHDEPLVVVQKNNIFDVTLSPDSELMVVTSDRGEKFKDEDGFVGSFYTCCTTNSKPLGTFIIDKKKDAFLFTPDSKQCIVCSGDFFKVIDITTDTKTKTLSASKHYKADKKDPFRTFVISPNGEYLLVTTLCENGFLYKRSKTGVFEKTDKKFKISPFPHGIDPVFTPKGMAFFASNGTELLKYDCQTGGKREIEFKDPIKSVKINSTETLVAVRCLEGCKVYEGFDFKTELLSKGLDADVNADVFFSPQGNLFALVSGNNCFIYRYSDHKLNYVQQFQCRNEISQGSFFGEQSYLMLSDKDTCYIYDSSSSKLIKSIKLSCLEGATIVVGKDGSNLIVICDKGSTVYGNYPMQTFFGIITKLLGQNEKQVDSQNLLK